MWMRALDAEGKQLFRDICITTGTTRRRIETGATVSPFEIQRTFDSHTGD